MVGDQLSIIREVTSGLLFGTRLRFNVNEYERVSDKSPRLLKKPQKESGCSAVLNGVTPTFLV